MAPKFQNVTYGDVIERDEAPNATYVQVADDTPVTGPATVLADLPSEGNAAELVVAVEPEPISLGEDYPPVEEPATGDTDETDEATEETEAEEVVTGDTEVNIEDQIEHLTLAQLKELAHDKSIDLDGVPNRKDDIRAALIAGLNEQE